VAVVALGTREKEHFHRATHARGIEAKLRFRFGFRAAKLSPINKSEP
jgi:hypothetical protein